MKATQHLSTPRTTSTSPDPEADRSTGLAFYAFMALLAAAFLVMMGMLVF